MRGSRSLRALMRTLAMAPSPRGRVSVELERYRKDLPGIAPPPGKVIEKSSFVRTSLQPGLAVR